jgi:hypothetical protein
LFLTTSGPRLATVGTTTDFWIIFKKTTKAFEPPKFLTLNISKTIQAILFKFGRLVVFAELNEIG